MAVIHQFTPVLSYGDAVSDYTLELQRFLREAGHESEIFVERCHPKVAHLCHPFQAYESRRSPEHLLILHFSIGSDVNIFVWLSPGKKMIIYHNITPHHYFIQVNPVLAVQCLLGRYQLKLFQNEVELALADSEFNRKELDATGIVPNAELPIFVSFDKFNREALSDLRELYDDDAVNWLFVGRMIPNKRIDALIRAFTFYQRHYESNARLFIVGTHRGFERHYTQLRQLVHQLDVSEHVIFTHHVTLDELVTFYKLADVYVSMSEHEGFCVPLLEAMYFQIPIVAYAAGAVPYTLRGGGILLRSQDPATVAEAVHLLHENPAVRSRVIRRQADTLAYYQSYPYRDMFISYVHSVVS